MTFNICTIVKDEGLFLEEWIEYHLNQGCKHFYIYDNDSSDETIRICKNYAGLGLLTYTPWSGKVVQKEAYKHFLDAHKEDEEWTACIDADEFIFGRTLKLGEVIGGFRPAVHAILLHWMFFGSNGETQYKKGFVTERFTKRASTVNGHVKSIIRPKYAKIANDLHNFEIEGLVVTSDTKVSVDRTPFFETPVEGLFYLCHYHVKSRDEYRNRIAKGRVDSMTPKDFDTNWEAHNINEVEDFGPSMFSKKLKETIKSRPWNQKTKK